MILVLNLDFTHASKLRPKRKQEFLYISGLSLHRIYVVYIQGGAFKWEHLNISVIVGRMKKLQRTKLYRFKGHI
ncbi:hypothetical protein WH47_01254 [Habropoda laboriosa]|uniref:Uncharacterized protein n=1 Tax=Habropoda laboriosa TaxID=597456 RepID=A0A0L7QZ81_9HYME|nr:hypothetical protein WH47_01254 [Habropoda laboriosa]